MEICREINACVGSSPKKNPVVTIDPSAIGATASGSNSRFSCGKTDSTVCDGSDVESSEEAAKKGKFPTRTWKSNTSVTEMLSCLRSYNHRQKCWEGCLFYLFFSFLPLPLAQC